MVFNIIETLSFFVPYTKPNSRWISNLNVNKRMLKLLQGNLGKYAENSRENASLFKGLLIINATNTFRLILTLSKLQGKTGRVDAFQKYQVTLLFTDFGGLFWLPSPLLPPCVNYWNISLVWPFFQSLTFFELVSPPHYFPAPADIRCSQGDPGWHFHLHGCSIRGLFLVLVTVGLQSGAGIVALMRTSRIQPGSFYLVAWPTVWCLLDLTFQDGAPHHLLCEQQDGGRGQERSAPSL